jgi:hypothetical protein
MFPLWFTFFGGFVAFLDLGPSILFLVFPLFWGVLVYLGLAGFYHKKPKSFSKSIMLTKVSISQVLHFSKSYLGFFL